MERIKSVEGGAIMTRRGRYVNLHPDDELLAYAKPGNKVESAHAGPGVLELKFYDRNGNLLGSGRRSFDFD